MPGDVRLPGQQPEKPEDTRGWEVQKRPSEDRQATEDKSEAGEWEKAKQEADEDQ
jgi:hypothetical protein